MAEPKQPWQVHDSTLRTLQQTKGAEMFRPESLCLSNELSKPVQEIINSRVGIYRSRYTIVRKVEAILTRNMTDDEKLYLNKLLLRKVHSEEQVMRHHTRSDCDSERPVGKTSVKDVGGCIITDETHSSYCGNNNKKHSGGVLGSVAAGMVGMICKSPKSPRIDIDDDDDVLRLPPPKQVPRSLEVEQKDADDQDLQRKQSTNGRMVWEVGGGSDYDSDSDSDWDDDWEHEHSQSGLEQETATSIKHSTNQARWQEERKRRALLKGISQRCIGRDGQTLTLRERVVNTNSHLLRISKSLKIFLEGKEEQRNPTLLEFEQIATEDTNDPLPEINIMRDYENRESNGIICTIGKYSEQSTQKRNRSLCTEGSGLIKAVLYSAEFVSSPVGFTFTKCNDTGKFVVSNVLDWNNGNGAVQVRDVIVAVGNHIVDWRMTMAVILDVMSDLPAVVTFSRNSTAVAALQDEEDDGDV